MDQWHEKPVQKIRFKFQMSRLKIPYLASKRYFKIKMSCIFYTKLAKIKDNDITSLTRG